MPLNTQSLKGAEVPPETPAKPKRRRRAAAHTPEKTQAKSPTGVYVAVTSGVAENVKSGESATFTKDVTRVTAGHWLLKQAPDAFRPAEDIVHYGVEQATAAPGENRGE